MKPPSVTACRCAKSSTGRTQPQRAELAELLDDRVDRHVTLATEQEPWMKDDDLGAARLRDARGVVEHADGHVELLAPLGVSHEAGDRSMDGQDDPGVAREF